MAADLLSGQSLNAIAASLNARKISMATDITRLRYGRTAKGTGWKPQSVRAILGNRAITGVTTYRGEVVRDGDGFSLLRAEPIGSDADYLRMQKILHHPAGRRVGARQSRVLLHVAMCGLCGADLYGKANARNRYYQCPNSTPARGVKERCSAPLVRTEVLESNVEQALLDSAGDVLMYEKIVTPANDVGAELARADEAVGALAAQVTSGALTAGQFAQVAAGLITQRDHLAAMAAPERVTWQPTGQTFAEFWAGLHDRGSFLRGAGIRAYVQDGRGESATWPALRAYMEAVGVRVVEPDGSTAVEPADDSIVVRELPGGRVVSVMLGTWRAAPAGGRHGGLTCCVGWLPAGNLIIEESAPLRRSGSFRFSGRNSAEGRAAARGAALPPGTLTTGHGERDELVDLGHEDLARHAVDREAVPLLSGYALDRERHQARVQGQLAGLHDGVRPGTESAGPVHPPPGRNVAMSLPITCPRVESRMWCLWNVNAQCPSGLRVSFTSVCRARTTRAPTARVIGSRVPSGGISMAWVMTRTRSGRASARYSRVALARSPLSAGRSPGSA
jgi:hypothetical protein